MADKKLGISGSEVTLPAGLIISLPVGYDQQVVRVTMSDGSRRYGFHNRKRQWQLTWIKITKANLDTLITLCDYNQTLRWQNNDESTTWYDVAITQFAYDSVDPISATKYYTASMVLEEA